MRNVHAVAALILSLALSSCSRGEMTAGDAQGVAAVSQQAPNSSSEEAPVPAELRAELAAMVKTVDSVLESSTEEPCPLTPEECAEEERILSESPAVVFDCGFTPGVDASLYGDDGIPMSTHGLTTLAKTVWYVESAGIDYGYPESTWRPKLDRHIDRQLRSIAVARKLEADPRESDYYSTDEMHSLSEYPIEIVHDMDTYRINVDPTREKLLPMDGCGAGESEIIVRTSPDARKVRMLSSFLASVCRLDPKSSIADCKHWTDVILGERRGASGIYEYEVTWLDGMISYGKVDTDPITLVEGEDTPVLVIRR